MVKAHLLTGMIAIMALGGAVNAGSPARLNSPETEKDARIIVEVDRDLANLSEQQILASQQRILNKIASNVTSNFTQVNSYTVLNNAFTIDVNSNDVDAISKLNGVKSVTIDKPHAYKSISSGGTYSAVKKGGSGVDPNRSAETMLKTNDTEDGAGTIIAILDNEFFFRGEHDAHDASSDCNFAKLDLDGAGHGCTGEMVYHEVYSPLASDVPVRFTFEEISKKFGTTKPSSSNGVHAYRVKGKTEGQEGSLYFNSKVPFYYDYGGTCKSYGSDDKISDFDVSSLIDYHGSHVSSITAANAPTYKGIAPKAQLACMKVFSDFKAKDIDKRLGFGDGLFCYDVNILEALEDCIKLGVDGINMSLGSDLDDFDKDTITMRTLTRLANQGIMSSISAGNAGKTSYAFAGSYGNWTTDMVETGILGSYANQVDSTIVASAQPNYIFFKNAIKIGTKNIAFEDQITNREGYDAEYNEEFFLADTDEPGNNFFQYIPGFGQESDYEKFEPEQLEGKILIVNRGSTSFADKYKIAEAHGAKGLIIVNNDPTASDFNFRCSFGDGFNPSIPCALVLYKDKLALQNADHGSFDFIKNEEAKNEDEYTMSTFSSDGASANYDLKPEITAPGDIIRGAVPPKTKEHKLTPLTSYEYLSGTSMSAPNYAGAQAVVLSKVTAPVYALGTNPSTETLAEIDAFRRTVDLRIASTANPMFESSNNPETNELNFASPRLQGAGMVDLDGAYHTDVYLKGKDDQGNVLNKTKVLLRDNEDITKGDLKISFVAHNDSSDLKQYDVKLTVMRPAIKNDNLVPTREYNYKTEISDIQYLPGVSFYDQYSDRQIDSYGTASYRDVFKISRDIEYYKSRYDYYEDKLTVIKSGMYYVASSGVDQESNINYQPLPGYDYQSTQDIVLAEVTGQVVEVAGSGETEITIDTYSLTAEQKAVITRYYPYGCAIEGYVSLEAKGDYPDLNIPYLGFYGGDGKNYKSAPVIEPFDFEKKNDVIYPSYLANDLAKSLVGKDNADMGSAWVIGYSNNPADVDTEKVLTNDLSLDMLSGFHKIGSDPFTESYGDNPSNELYVGNPHKSNTMIISQYIMRSVNDNYFTITRKSDNKEVYRSALSDSLYGERYGRHPLYKSHVDGSYLAAGYIGHKAMAKIPLFDVTTNEAFEDGKYDITFNYQLAGYNNEWVSKSYTFIVDSTEPIFAGISEYGEGKDTTVRFSFKDAAISYGIVGYEIRDVQYDSSKDEYYMDVNKQEVLDAIKEFGMSSSNTNRLYLKVVDKAYGETGVLVHFSTLRDLSNYEALSHRNFAANNDFKYEGNNLVVFSIDTQGNETVVDVDNDTQTKINGEGGDIPTRPNGPVQEGEVFDVLLITFMAVGGGVVIMGTIAVVVAIVKAKKRKSAV